MLWSGDKAWKQSGERRMLCGLQLPGADNQQIAFKGKVADLDAAGRLQFLVEILEQEPDLADAVADDAVGEQVLDDAGVELALTGGVLGDVGDPGAVGLSCGEVALDVVVVDGAVKTDE